MRAFRALISAILLLALVTMLFPDVPTAHSQAPQMCYVEDYNGRYGETVPPAPAKLDKDGDRVITRNDWMLCSSQAIEYMNYCGITTVEQARAGICNRPGDGSPGPKPDPQPQNRPSLEATVSLNVRSGPSTMCERLGLIYPGRNYSVLAKNNDSSWLKISFNGRTGWVAAQIGDQRYVRLDDTSLMFVVPRENPSGCLEPDLSDSPESGISAQLSPWAREVFETYFSEVEWEQLLSLMSGAADVAQCAEKVAVTVYTVVNYGAFITPPDIGVACSQAWIAIEDFLRSRM